VLGEAIFPKLHQYDERLSTSLGSALLRELRVDMHMYSALSVAKQCRCHLVQHGRLRYGYVCQF